MSFKTLPKSLVDACVEVSSERNEDYAQLTAYYMAEGLKKFGVKRESQLGENDRVALNSWVQIKIDEACSLCKMGEEDHMPGDDVLYTDDDEMMQDLGEDDDLTASDVVKAELDAMGKSLDELTPEEKKELFNKVDDLITAKNESYAKGEWIIYDDTTNKILRRAKNAKEAKKIMNMLDNLGKYKDLGMISVEHPAAKQMLKSLKEAKDSYKVIDPKKLSKGDVVDRLIAKGSGGIGSKVRYTNAEVISTGSGKPEFRATDEKGKTRMVSPRDVIQVLMKEVLDLTSGTEEEAIKRAIDDFLKSDAPQFKGKTKEEKINMAIAAVKSARGTARNEDLELEYVEEGLSAKQISMLRDAWGDIKTIDPNSAGYKKLINFLNKLPQHQLKALSKANINFVSMLAKNRISENITEDIDLSQEEQSDADDVATNGAVAVGDAMSAEPIQADVIKDTTPTDGTHEFRLLLQYATSGDVFVGGPFQATHIYPPLSFPAASSVKELSDLIDGMPFFNRVVEKAIETAMETYE